MTWLDNPLANLEGPSFLLLYAAVVTGAVVALWWALRRWDPTASLPPPPVPPEPDPYEIAHLRGGTGEVARVAVLELLERGYLRHEDGVLRPSPEAPDRRHLSGVVLAAYDGIVAAPAALSLRQVSRGDALTEHLAAHDAACSARLEAEHLLATGSVRRWRRQCGLAAVGLVLGLGGYKLFVALHGGRWNVGFLVLLGLAGATVLAFLYSRQPRQSLRGRRHLDRLRLAFESLRRATPADEVGASASLPLAFGLFGTAVLAGTSYGFFAEELRQAGSGAMVGGDVFAGGDSSCGSSCNGGCGASGCGGCGG